MAIAGAVRTVGVATDIGAHELCAATEGAFLRGDANGDGLMDVSDAIAVLRYLFLGTLELPCLDAADLDDTGDLDLTDAIRGLLHLFVSGPEPPEPFPDCGYDPTSDRLDCAGDPACR